MTAVIEVAAPPEVPRPASAGRLGVLVPIVLAVATLGVTAATYLSGSMRNPAFFAFPAMMLASVVATAVTGLGRRRRSDIDRDRADYLNYLSDLRAVVTEIAGAQHLSLVRAHPDPGNLWTLVGGPSMWQRAPAEPDFCRVRVGVGFLPLETRLVAARAETATRSDPVTAAALTRFLQTHSTITDAPLTIRLPAAGRVRIDGDATRVRGLLRAMVCQLAVLHPPGRVLIAAAVSTAHMMHWDWLKWLPHNQHPGAGDLAGAARMVYRTRAEAGAALGDVTAAQMVLIVDTGMREDGVVADMCTLEVGGHRADSLAITHAGATELLAAPDRLDAVEVLVCARRLAAYDGGDGAGRGSGADWTDLLGIGDATRFDPAMWWRSHDPGDRLRVPIGAAPDGFPVELDIKEAAERGMGPHGLCIGATGSGKSELLRTIALGMMVRNSPEVLNLLLVDFKGGATFLEFSAAPHVAAVITNLADEAPLVARMRDALAGEMNRRQQLLRQAGNAVSVAAYQSARGPQSVPLPTLFIIVDEFAELLSRHPEFIDMFVAIGRLGRSLGMHLLLASQRLDEGRLRGLEANLSYRICLKTLSAGESRAVLGVQDAYDLPNTPGAGLMQAAGRHPIRFQGTCVSGTRSASGQPDASGASATVARRFTTEPVGTVEHAGAFDGSGASVLRTVLDAMAGHGPAAHRVWLPPLDRAPALSALLPACAPSNLTVPIGVVDRPYDQSRTPLIVDLSHAAGNVAVVGAPQSGKSTTLRTLITALAATHDPERVQCYCLDFGGGMLSSLRDLPHVGAVADRAQPALVRRVVSEMESAVRIREALRREHQSGTARVQFADVFLVVDGWDSLRREFDWTEAVITAIAVQGLSFGVHVVLTASRWAEIRPGLKDQIGTRVELRLGDPADSELDRKRAREVPEDRPGRGLSRDGLHMMIARPELGPAQVRRGGRPAPPILLLPNHVDYDQLVAGDPSGMLLGLDERLLRPVAVDFTLHQHLLVLGDRGCGKTAVLRTLCREVVRTHAATRARLFVVDLRRTLLGVVDAEHGGGYAMSPAGVSVMLPDLLEMLRARMPAAGVSHAQLRARSWWSGPDIYLVVDDYDLVATAAGNPLSILLEYLPHASDLGLHVVVARRSGGAARALFEPLLAELRDAGCLGLMMSGRPEDGVLLGSTPAVTLPPGRGVLIDQSGAGQLVQVAWSPEP